MKKHDIARNNARINKLALRSETIRVLSEQELTLVVAGNCLNASVYSQTTSTNLPGVC